MAISIPKTRRVWRRTDTTSPNTPLLELDTETLPSPLPSDTLLIKVHAISLNYRDANITHGGNPWPVIPQGIPCSDAAGTIVAIGGEKPDAGVGNDGLQVGDVVTPIIDQASITGREQARCWLAADVDGVLADYLVMHRELVVKIPKYLTALGMKGMEEASLLNCAGLTAWSALKGLGVGGSVLVQGTGGVSMIALKLARAMGCKVLLSSSSDEKLQKVAERYTSPPLLTVNYAKNKDWHEETIKLSGGDGVDLVLENGGTSSLVKSLKCTKRGGIVSQVGYLGKQDARDLEELVPILIDRKINLRGINVGSKHDLEDMYAAVAATQMRFDDIVDARFDFQKADEAIEHVWAGKQVGKVIVDLD